MSSLQLWAVTAIGTTDTQLTPTVSASDELVIDSVIAHNNSGATRTVEWFLVPSGGSPASSNRIHKSTIADGDTDFADGALGRVVVAGAALYAKADAVGVQTAGTGRRRTV